PTPRRGYWSRGSCTWTATTGSSRWVPTRPSRSPGRTRSAARRPPRPEGPRRRRPRQERGASMSNIEIRDDRAAGRLEAVAGGDVVGRMEYFMLDEPRRALVPAHTVLARELYGIASREGSAVAPLCPYVAKWAQRHQDEAPSADPELMAAAKKGLADHPEMF